MFVLAVTKVDPLRSSDVITLGHVLAFARYIRDGFQSYTRPGVISYMLNSYSHDT